ncbi:hypothetical protein BY458DRAFT_519079 [Sporodiniella umbellata]|nr:hypothetical protein BY458DRAFT_519079 [Sporodiniella umbellata]
MPPRPMACTSAMTSISNTCPKDRSANTFLHVTPLLAKAAKLSVQHKNPRVDDINNSYYSFCSKCGIDILIYSHEIYCLLSK